MSLKTLKALIFNIVRFYSRMATLRYITNSFFLNFFIFLHFFSFRYVDRVNSVFNAPENVPLLVDLVKVKDENLKTAFYHYMQDTLVAEDMEQVNN